MAEYYPLLAKAVGSLPNSTPDSRRVVYERARKALIGQLRTMHPPIPDDDIESESVALDRAIERLESELANGSGAPAPAAAKTVEKPSAPDAGRLPAAPKVKPPAPLAKPPIETKPPIATKPPPIAAPPAAVIPPAIVPSAETKPVAAAPTGESGALGPAERRAIPPLRTKPLKPPVPKPPAAAAALPAMPPPPIPAAPVAMPPDGARPHVEPPATTVPALADGESSPLIVDPGKKARPPRTDLQRPIAPQPPVAQAPKRRLWIIPVALSLVIAGVAFAAWKLRDHPETITSNKPPPQSQGESDKIAQRVNGPTPDATKNGQAVQPPISPAAPTTAPSQQQSPPPVITNPEVPVAYRAALLIRAPDEPDKVKTFLGTVVWKLNNVPQGQNDAVGIAIEADIDLPDNKMKAVITIEKNTDASLPASHTIKVSFIVNPGSFSGNVKEIGTPQLRSEDSSTAPESLAGVTVPTTTNAFLVGLSPGNDESVNVNLLSQLPWIDVPMRLENGQIAKLTFEKGAAGQRDIIEAFQIWQKQ